MPKRNGDEEIILWKLVKAVAQLERKIDHLVRSQDGFIRKARAQRTWLSKVRASLIEQKKYSKELERALKLQTEDEK